MYEDILNLRKQLINSIIIIFIKLNINNSMEKTQSSYKDLISSIRSTNSTKNDLSIEIPKMLPGENSSLW